MLSGEVATRSLISACNVSNVLKVDHTSGSQLAARTDPQTEE